ncbi:hypothetical protein HELRODRAFT_159143 [Helobdella robusta]|uniref:Fibrinogen C-terminal domain-containing protein n=1 Tax=Helobdella robusta TaxID=6412 RepID=T1ENN5_HELRO|nr:hypothetical protein HELRODRAFT_159143 [Helobdella robusta]ESO12582.1 hypothetical protein HELRODRAFT_159143 [Helobdella robusta]
MRKERMENLTTTGKIAGKTDRNQQRITFVKSLCHLLNNTTFQLLQSVKDRVSLRQKTTRDTQIKMNFCDHFMKSVIIFSIIIHGVLNNLARERFSKTILGGVPVCCQDSSNSTVRFVNENLSCQGPARCSWMCQRDPTCSSFNFIHHHLDPALNSNLIECNFFVARCYSVLPLQNCSHFQAEKKSACSFPYTLNGSVYFGCTSSSTCLNGNGVQMACTDGQPTSSQFTPINLSVPNVPTSNVPAYTKAGWLVIHQANVSSNESFNKTWNQYKYGFGNLDEVVFSLFLINLNFYTNHDKGNYWLGNEYVSQLTWMMPNVTWRLHVSVQASANKKFYSTEYWRFRIKSEEKLYAIELAGNVPRDAGNAFGNASQPQFVTNLRAFSTPDKDNDGWSGGKCANKNGWWFNMCGVSVLTSTPQIWETVKRATAAADFNVIYSTMMIMAN